MLDKEKDIYIKAQLQKDKLISKNADEIINNFLKEGYNMEEKNQTQSKILQKKNPWKKILATAACLVVLLGGANVYAHSKGYGNLFFMIKYLITGQNEYVEGKDNILSDKDITISYEPINITENLSIVIKKMQIKENTAKLIINEYQKETDDSNLPLNFEVTDEQNNKLCEHTGSLQGKTSNTNNELILNNFKNDTKVITLKVNNNQAQTLANLKIDIDNRTVEVIGAEEALKKISEIDLKEFLGHACGLTLLPDQEEAKIFYSDLSLLGVAFDVSYEKATTEKINGVTAYLASDINEAIESIVDIKASDVKIDNVDFKEITNNGTKYYAYTVAGDMSYRGECIDVNNISYCNGIYTVTYTYWFPPENPEANINDFEIFEQTINIKLNENTKYSKFKIVSSEEPITIQDPTVKPEEIIDIIEPEPTVTPTAEPTQTAKPTQNPTAKVDNYATSMSWSNYWAPGLKFQYPTEFNLTDVSTGNNPGELAVTIEGLARGINKDTNEIVDSNLTIKIYEPKFISQEEGENFINGDRAGLTNNRGMFWGLDYTETTDKKYTYKYVSPLSDGGYVEHKIVFDTDNRENWKVINIENWILGSTQETSY